MIRIESDLPIEINPCILISMFTSISHSSSDQLNATFVTSNSSKAEFGSHGPGIEVSMHDVSSDY